MKIEKLRKIWPSLIGIVFRRDKGQWAIASALVQCSRVFDFVNIVAASPSKMPFLQSGGGEWRKRKSKKAAALCRGKLLIVASIPAMKSAIVSPVWRRRRHAHGGVLVE